ncbi:YraN family protein [Fusibacter paucivorans]|uniref:YraN family protein n=1 Tax=Fusibacter paucivorans TaxID=76009 RepID=A0ABS5PQZ7_9FIRM|nr:YraN family protein [Fusibacter paucivorans]MBS7527478.1 YraN family protein [Fusibacter paucivorans]
MNYRQRGAKGETLGIAYLEACGFEFVDRNIYIGGAELDLVMKKADSYYLIEVKYRQSLRYGKPIEAMTYQKCQHFKRACIAYMRSIENFKHYHYSFLGILKTDDGYTYHWIEDFFN